MLSNRSSIAPHSRPENLKKSRQKTREIKAIKTEVGTKLHDFPFLDTSCKDKNWIFKGDPKKNQKFVKMVGQIVVAHTWFNAKNTLYY